MRACPEASGEDPNSGHRDGVLALFLLAACDLQSFSAESAILTADPQSSSRLDAKLHLKPRLHVRSSVLSSCFDLMSRGVRSSNESDARGVRSYDVLDARGTIQIVAVLDNRVATGSCAIPRQDVQARPSSSLLDP